MGKASGSRLNLQHTTLFPYCLMMQQSDRAAQEAPVRLMCAPQVLSVAAAHQHHQYVRNTLGLSSGKPAAAMLLLSMPGILERH